MLCFTRLPLDRFPGGPLGPAGDPPGTRRRETNSKSLTVCKPIVELALSQHNSAPVGRDLSSAGLNPTGRATFFRITQRLPATPRNGPVPAHGVCIFDGILLLVGSCPPDRAVVLFVSPRSRAAPRNGPVSSTTLGTKTAPRWYPHGSDGVRTRNSRGQLLLQIIVCLPFFWERPAPSGSGSGPPGRGRIPGTT